MTPDYEEPTRTWQVLPAGKFTADITIHEGSKQITYVKRSNLWWWKHGAFRLYGIDYRIGGRFSGRRWLSLRAGDQEIASSQQRWHGFDVFHGHRTYTVRPELARSPWKTVFAMEGPCDEYNVESAGERVMHFQIEGMNHFSQGMTVKSLLSLRDELVVFLISLMWARRYVW